MALILRNLPLRNPSLLTARTLRRILQVTDGVSARIFRMLNDLAIEAIETDIRRWRQFQDRFIHRFFQINGLLSILILLGIFISLSDGFPAVKHLGLSGFFSVIWNPTSYVKETYGLGAMIISTLMVTFGAMLLAVPIGLGCAAYLAEVAPSWVREILKPVIEILAGIPSVVLGFLGIVVVGPAIAQLFHLPNGLNALNGFILLAVMSLPTIISISEDAISSVPRIL